jgi:putative transposase
MTWTPAHLTQAQQEQRRTEAMQRWNNPNRAETQKQLAEEFGVTRHTMRRWVKRDQAGTLQAQPRQGRPKRLSQTQRQALVTLLKQPPTVYGYTRLGWTLPLVTDLIKQKFNVKYNSDHVGRILHDLKLSPQRPQVRNVKRDEEKIKTWLFETYPSLKKVGRSGLPSDVHG